MNYAKIVESAVQLFPKKIKVTFVHAVTGRTIYKHKIGLQNLPAAFNKPTILEIGGISWRILKADPPLADDFSFDKKLTLHVVESESFQQPKDIFEIPTVPEDELATTAVATEYSDYSLDITREDWRQIEFFPVELLPIVEEEMTLVGAILFPGHKTNTLLGYENKHIRKKTSNSNLLLSYNKFSTHLEIKERGNIIIDKENFLQNGFAIQSGNHTWYGKLSNNCIHNLCLLEFDCLDDELYNVMENMQLLLADWCNGQI